MGCFKNSNWFRFTLITVILAVTSACAKPAETPATTPTAAADPNPYYLYVASGFPTASAINIVTKWDPNGNYVSIVYDYANVPGYSPQGLASLTLNGITQLLALSFNGANGRIDSFNANGTSFSGFINDASALVAGARRVVTTMDGGFIVPRTAATAGIEKFNSARQRVGSGTTPRYVAAANCPATAIVGLANGVTSTGVDVVVGVNAAVTPANKIGVWNTSTTACLPAAVSPTGATVPVSTMWPVDVMFMDPGKILTLWYPFTGSTTAQIYRFNVGATTVDSGVLSYDDVGGDIAVTNGTPGALSAAMSQFTAADGTRYVFVATSNNSILKFTYNATTGALTKVGTSPLIYNTSLIKSPAAVWAMSP